MKPAKSQKTSLPGAAFVRIAYDANGRVYLRLRGTARFGSGRVARQRSASARRGEVAG